MSRPFVEVENLRVEGTGGPRLDVPRLSVAEGEVLGIIGPNGAGKSTLLQALALLIPAAMAYRFGGQSVRLPEQAPAIRQQMAVVFQDPLLLSGTVADNVALGLRLRRLPSQVIQERTGRWLGRLGVAHLRDRPAHTLSGGEAQRVSLARALALEPRLLMLDEPFASLDVLTRAPLLRELSQLLRAERVTTLFVTHDFGEIPLLADRVAVMFDGRVVQAGTPDEVFRAPADPRTERLVQAAADLSEGLRRTRA